MNASRIGEQYQRDAYTLQQLTPAALTENIDKYNETLQRIKTNYAALGSVSVSFVFSRPQSADNQPFGMRKFLYTPEPVEIRTGMNGSPVSIAPTPRYSTADIYSGPHPFLALRADVRDGDSVNPVFVFGEGMEGEYGIRTTVNNLPIIFISKSLE